jgi:four helix bundle protein
MVVPVPVPEVFDMPFDHERLDVDRVALDFLVLADDTIAQLPRGRSHLADPLHRAATSIVLPLAEGAGTFSQPDKRRDDLSAAGSATECAARVDVVQRLRLVPTERHTEAKARLERIASRVITLAKSLQAPPEGRKNGNGNGEDSDAKRDLHPLKFFLSLFAFLRLCAFVLNSPPLRSPPFKAPNAGQLRERLRPRPRKSRFRR